MSSAQLPSTNPADERRPACGHTLDLPPPQFAEVPTPESAPAQLGDSVKRLTELAIDSTQLHTGVGADMNAPARQHNSPSTSSSDPNDVVERISYLYELVLETERSGSRDGRTFKSLGTNLEVDGSRPPKG